MPERENLEVNLNLKWRMPMALAKKNTAETEVSTEEQVAAEVAETSEVEASAETDDALEEETPQQEAQPPAVSQAAPPAVVSANRQATEQLADSGFEGLHIDWTSFPTVVIDDAEFATSDGNSLNVKEIFVRLMQSRKRYVLRTDTPSDDDAELAYTYDLSELDNPDSELAQKVKKWKEEDNLNFKVKEYIEAVAVVEDAESTLDQQMVLLQIPPTSVGKFSGYTTSNLLIKQKKPSEYLTRCYVGAKVVKAKKPFTPWAFEYKG